MEPYTVIVSGVQRGGTSMVAGVMGELGIDLGPVALNHEDPNFLVLAGSELQSYVDARNRDVQRWGFKLPGAHVDKNLEAIAFRNPIWVFVFRNVVSNIDSLLAHGAENTLEAYERICVYYQAMLKSMRDCSVPYVLVSYERAVAEPERFVKELAVQFNLEPDRQTVEKATRQITGDGGGYLPASRHYHSVRVLTNKFENSVEITETCHPLVRSRLVIMNCFFIEFQDEELPFEVDYLISRRDSKHKTISVIFDLGEGYSDLAAYDFALNDDITLIRVQHGGAVHRVGFGARDSLLPNDISLLRCLRGQTHT